jgi:hypothetical protein
MTFLRSIVIFLMIHSLAVLKSVAEPASIEPVPTEQIKNTIHAASKDNDPRRWLDALNQILRYSHAPDAHDRQDVIRLFAELRRSLSAKIDPTFRTGKIVLPINPSPSDQSFPSGIEPSVITDPNVRRQYEEDIASNNARGAKINLQITLSRTLDSINRHVVLFCRNAYGNSPAERDLEERALAIFDNAQTLLQKIDKLRSDSASAH